ncbi:toll/interleukin-1 receptor domain-containing protein, partial [Aestuariivita boseongensis]|uniref:toll/interleukin-1 receptor domain-containing protein n=1 Tax=Aestuariivita boseongensis TaxID=1470562 RepID=UPI00155D910A
MDIDENLDGSTDEAKVFVSYSRKDREQAQRVSDALRARHFGVFRDTEDILPTEEWRTRLSQLIEEADTIVFLLSPHSATSEVCAWEVEYASSLNKRIAPIVIEDVNADLIPPLLSRLNFIFCTPRDPFENAVDTLVSALSVDIDWIREHTRLNGLARRWEEAGQPGHLLLRAQDIIDAENWRDDRPDNAPEVTRRQAAFIAASRQAASRRQRNWIIGSVSTALMTAALAVFAYFQSVEASLQRAEAETQRA